jgi:hypothetical protein
VRENNMTTPDANNLYLGAGEVFFDRFDASGVSTGLRHLGNVDEFTSNVTVDSVTKKSAMSGTRGILAEVITGTTAEIGMSLSEYESNNLALVLLGNESAYTQAAEVAFTGRALVGASFAFDVWYEFKNAAGTPILNPTVTAIKQGATTINPAGYEVRAEAGMIRFLSSYAGANPAALLTAITWDGSTPAVVAGDGKRLVQALAVGKVQGRLRYISATDQANGPRVIVDVWKVNLNPDGDLPLIGEDFGAFKLKGKAQKDATKAAGSQYIRVMYL